MTINQQRYLQVGGKRLEMAWHGPPPEEAPTLVFLHEGLGCVAQWREFPADLAAAAGCGALVYSRLGYGGSDPCPLPRPVRFMHDESIQVLPDLLEANNSTAAKNKLLLLKEQQIRAGGKIDYDAILGKWKYWAKNTLLPRVAGKK